jgi:2-iminobutanoate/2-iminopropanoate deaminase
VKQFHSAGANPDEMPFSPAATTQGRVIYLSGATAFPLIHKHPHDEAELAVPETIIDQTRAALGNLKIALEAAGGQVTDIVKVTIFNTDMDAQDDVNRAYLEFFGDHRPCRSHVGVNRLVGSHLKIEIEAIAVLED